jgi:hypothetical protein
MAYATTSDVAAELGRLASSYAETEQWQAWIERVERTIERGFRRAGLVLSDVVFSGTLTSGDVRDVEVAAVIRKIQNPTWGLTSTTRSIDDAAVTTRREGGGEADPLDLLSDEWLALLPSKGNRGHAFSVMPS